MKKKNGFRKIINIIHLWVGIPSALILFVVCLSGTTYVFQKEITRWVDSDKFTLNPPQDAKPLPVANLVAVLEKEKKGWKVTGLQIPERSSEAWMFNMSPKGGEERKQMQQEGNPKGKGERKLKNESDKTKAPSKQKNAKQPVKNFLVNPYTGTIQGDAETTTSRFFNTVMQLHRWLLMDKEIGIVITGTAAMLFVLLEITGLILWMPAKLKSWKRWKAWKPGFTVKLKAGWKRINHDLHKALGFYTFVIITIMGLTGPAMGFDWYKTGFAKVLGTTPVKKGIPSPSSSAPAPGTNALAVEDLLAKVSVIYPYAGDIRITFAKDSSGSVVFAKTKNGFFASAAIDRVTLDQYTGNVLKLERFSDKKLGEKIVMLTKAIHTGEIFGTFSKILYFIACLIATSLPVTGTLIWLNKRKKKKHFDQPQIIALDNAVASV